MSERIVKRSVVIAGHSTSISLENAFWVALRQSAEARDISVAALIAEIDNNRTSSNLSSAIRVFLLLQGQTITAAAAANPAVE